MTHFRIAPLLSFVLIFYPMAITPDSEAYFAPDDHPTHRLLELIDGSHQRIYAAVYMLTDPAIAQALIKAKKRGVDVQLILDPSSVESSFGKGKLLKKNSIEIFVFSPPHKKKRKSSYYSALMHNKFAIIDNRLWTGSFNWTKSANNKNQENVIILEDSVMCDKFLSQFQVMKTRCTHYSTSDHQIPEPSWSDYFDTFKEKVWTWVDGIKRAVLTT